MNLAKMLLMEKGAKRTILILNYDVSNDSILQFSWSIYTGKVYVS
jgi:hypothetical protein